ncbi:MAG: hypothetical protein K2N28_00745 [Muribaculaceae bacterium]|nr:hypothetical protein [Muribaculaceae bacterium]
MKSIYLIITLLLATLIGCNGHGNSNHVIKTIAVDSATSVDSIETRTVTVADNSCNPRDSIFDENLFFVRPYRITSIIDTVGAVKAVRIIKYMVPEDTIIYGQGSYTTHDSHVAIIERDIATGRIDTTFIDRHKMLKWFGIEHYSSNSDTTYDPRYYNQNDFTIYWIEKSDKYNTLSNDTVSVRIGVTKPDSDMDAYLVYRKWSGGDTILPLILVDDSDGLGWWVEQ